MLIKILVATVTAWLFAGNVDRSDPPLSFADPTNITNVWAPFEPGAVKVFRGRDGRARTTVVVEHLEQPRTIDYGARPVACCVLEESCFENGELVEVTRHYLAQGDAGNVWYFGELSTEYVDGKPARAAADSWIVGGPTRPEDPSTAKAVAVPTLYMPSRPEVGMTFITEDFGDSVQALTVVRTGVRTRVEAGRFANAILIQEQDDADDADGNDDDHVWVVPGVGRVKTRSKGNTSELVATSLEEAPVGP